MNSKEISKDIIKKILAGEFPEHSKLDSENKLATHYQCNRHTIRSAISDLIEKGYIKKVPGGTSYISRSHKNHILSLSSMSDIHIDDNLQSKILKFKKIKANKLIAQKLNIQIDSHIWYIVRARYINSKFKHLEYTFMPFSLFEDLTFDICSSSITKYIEEFKNFKISHSYKTIEATTFKDTETTLLKIPKNSLALEITHIGVLTNSRIYEFSINKHYNQKIDFFSKR